MHARTHACELTSSDRDWIGVAIETWSRASEALGRSLGEMPWTILYDERCVVHLNPRQGRPRASSGTLSVTLNGDPVPARSVGYTKQFTLPNGQKLTAEPVAFTSLADDGGTFFVMALPSLWIKSRGATPGEDASTFLSGVLVHEVTHTLHLAAIATRIEEIEKRMRVPSSLDDDSLQKMFVENADYVADYQREIALYRRAVETPDDAAARGLVREALDASRARRAKYFQGEHAFFQEVEPLFLNMEGVASWVAYTVVGRGGDPLAFSGRHWSQQEGLLLFLLLDRFDQEWKSWVFDPAVPDPFAMLRVALDAG